MLYQGNEKVEMVKKGNAGAIGRGSNNSITVTRPKKAEGCSVYVGIPKCVCDVAGLKKGDYVTVGHVFGKIGILERTNNPSIGYKLSYPGGRKISTRLRIQIYDKYLARSFFDSMDIRAYHSPKHEAKTNKIEFYVGSYANQLINSMSVVG